MNYIKVSDEHLVKYNTLGIKAIATTMVFPLNEDGVKEVYERYGDCKMIVIGKGSNVLFSKTHYDESYVFINFKLMDFKSVENNNIYAQAGVCLSDLSWFALENDIKGFEFLEDIPGTVGGALVMNASTYNNSIGQLVKKVRVYDVKKNKIFELNVTDHDFEYRNSTWSKNNYIILSSWFSGEDGNYLDSLEELLNIKKNRYVKQPRNFPNAGSVFKRPIHKGRELQVWKLIESVGLRGYRKGGAMISNKHPGFIVNVNNATYEDIIFIVNMCQHEVLNRFGVKLELEWKII